MSSPDGLTDTASVTLHKGRPVVSWTLRNQTPHSGVPRDPVIRTSSDGAVSAASTTPATCAFAGRLLRASAGDSASRRSLGTCSVTVTVAETARWEPSRVRLTTQVVEAPIVAQFAPDPPATARRGERITLTLRLVQPDTSVDVGVGASFQGCFDNITSEFRSRVATVSVLIPVDAPTECNVMAYAGALGTTVVVGATRLNWIIRITG